MQPEQIDAELQSIQQKIVEKRFDEALNDIDALGTAVPENSEALYMSAVCHRYKNEFDKALENLAKLKARVPDHGRGSETPVM